MQVGLLRLKHPLTEWRNLSLANLQPLRTGLTNEIALEAYALPGNFHKDRNAPLIVTTA